MQVATRILLHVPVQLDFIFHLSLLKKVVMYDQSVKRMKQ